MNSFKAEIENYLAGIGYLTPVPLGGKEQELQITKEANDDFAEKLYALSKSHDYVIKLTITLACVLFAALLALTGFQLVTCKWGAIFTSGGAVASLIAILKFLPPIWVDMKNADMALHALRYLTPEQAAEFVTNIYLNGVRPSSKPAAAKLRNSKKQSD